MQSIADWVRGDQAIKHAVTNKVLEATNRRPEEEDRQLKQDRHHVRHG